MLMDVYNNNLAKISSGLLSLSADRVDYFSSLLMFLYVHYKGGTLHELYYTYTALLLAVTCENTSQFYNKINVQYKH